MPPVDASDGGAVGRVGVPQDETIPPRCRPSSATSPSPAAPRPARAYLDDLLPDVLEGRIEPGRVLDRTVGLGDVPDGYRVMNDREAIKVMVIP